MTRKSPQSRRGPRATDGAGFAGLVIAGMLAAAAQTGPARASAGDPSGICDQVSAIASARTGVPLAVLRAIALTETGRTRGGQPRPWPWTVNMEGEGLWFETADAALAYVREHHANGARSFDMGCFQINYKWHHQHFSSLDEMFDPEANALYAARFLADLFAEKGNWAEAAGAYHSRNPEFATRYRERFERILARLAGEEDQPPRATDGVPPAAPAGPARTRVNSFPLLQAGGGGFTPGSLVPLAGLTRGRSLFGDGGG